MEEIGSLLRGNVLSGSGPLSEMAEPNQSGVRSQLSELNALISEMVRVGRQGHVEGADASSQAIFESLKAI